MNQRRHLSLNDAAVISSCGINIWMHRWWFKKRHKVLNIRKDRDLTFPNGISGIQSVVFSSSTVLCCIPLSLRSLEGGGITGVVGLCGELTVLRHSSSGQILLENIL